MFHQHAQVEPMRRLLSVLVLGVIANVTQAQSPTAFDFLRLEPSARAAALGGTAVVLTEADVSAFFYNPALLNTDMHRQATVSYLNHLSDLQAGFAGYGRDFGNWGTAAAGLRFVHWGTIPRTDELGQRSVEFSANDLALTLGLARSYGKRLRYGLNLHMVYTAIADYSASALAADVGLVWHDPEALVTVAGAVNNLGLLVGSLGTTQDELPLDVRASVSKRLRYIPVLAALTLHSLQDAFELASASDAFRHAIFSLEFQAIPVFHIRLGYSHNRRNLKSDSRLDLAGFGTGFGLKVRGIGLDYAFNSWSFAGLHQFTLKSRL